MAGLMRREPRGEVGEFFGRFSGQPSRGEPHADAADPAPAARPGIGRLQDSPVAPAAHHARQPSQASLVEITLS